MSGVMCSECGKRPARRTYGEQSSRSRPFCDECWSEIVGAAGAGVGSLEGDDREWAIRAGARGSAFARATADDRAYRSWLQSGQSASPRGLWGRLRAFFLR